MFIVDTSLFYFHWQSLASLSVVTAVILTTLVLSFSGQAGLEWELAGTLFTIVEIFLPHLDIPVPFSD